LAEVAVQPLATPHQQPVVPEVVLARERVLELPEQSTKDLKGVTLLQLAQTILEAEEVEPVRLVAILIIQLLPVTVVQDFTLILAALLLAMQEVAGGMGWTLEQFQEPQAKVVESVHQTLILQEIQDLQILAVEVVLEAVPI